MNSFYSLARSFRGYRRIRIGSSFFIHSFMGWTALLAIPYNALPAETTSNTRTPGYRIDWRILLTTLS